MSIFKRSNADGGARFERDLARMFKRLGYRVQRTPGSNDHGADLILRKGRRRIAVQAKCYAKPVGNAAVQEAFAAQAFYECSEAWVVTNSTFTQAARDQAAPCKVRLVDGATLERMRRRSAARTWLPAILVLVFVAAVTALLVAGSSARG